MKRIISFFVVISILALTTACSGSSSDKSNNDMDSSYSESMEVSSSAAEQPEEAYSSDYDTCLMIVRCWRSSEHTVRK